MKNKIRRLIKEKINNFSDTKESWLLCQAFLKTAIWQKAQNIMIYAPLPGEVNVSYLLLDQTKNFIFPKIKNNNELEIYLVKDKKELKIGCFGVLEPREQCFKISKKELDLIIVPGLAFYKKGDRLGRGKAYYDQFLKTVRCQNKKVVTVSLIFDFQLLANIPTEQHDQEIDLVLTQKNLDKMILCD